MAEERCRQARRHHALARRVLVLLLRARLTALLNRSDLQRSHIDDPFQLAHPIEKIQHREIRAINFHFEGGFGEKLFRRGRLGGVTANFDARLRMTWMN